MTFCSKTPPFARKGQFLKDHSEKCHIWPFLANYGPISHRIWGFPTQNLYQVCGDTRWGILCSFWASGWFLLGMERPKMAIFGRFWLIMGLFVIEYEDYRPETCTKPVGILVEAFYVVLGPRFVSFRYGKAKKGHFWLFSANYGPIFHRIWGFRNRNIQPTL